MGNTLDDQSIDRIGRSVRFTEGWRRERPAAGMAGVRARAAGDGEFSVYVAAADGGSAGGGAPLYCNRTYSIFEWGVNPNDEDAEPIATKVPLSGMGNGWRALPIQLDSGHVAEGFMRDGTFIMTDVDESPLNVINCSPPA